MYRVVLALLVQSVDPAISIWVECYCYDEGTKGSILNDLDVVPSKTDDCT